MIRRAPPSARAAPNRAAPARAPRRAVVARSAPDPNLFGPEPADEEPDRFGHYRYDIPPERYQKLIRGFKSAYYSQRPTIGADALKNLMIDKYGRVYPIQLCLGEHQQVFLQIEPTPLGGAPGDPPDALDPLLSMTAATLSEWGVAADAIKAVAKHPAKRMPPHGLFLALPIYFYDAPSAPPPTSPPSPPDD